MKFVNKLTYKKIFNLSIAINFHTLFRINFVKITERTRDIATFLLQELCYILFCVIWYGHHTDAKNQFIIDHTRYGLRTPNEAFFIEPQKFWAWADKSGR